jgi:hypothetical protein
VRDTGKVLKLIENIKEISKNINFYIPIYPNIGAENEDVKFSKKCKIFIERAGRKIMTGMKNSVRLQSLSKRRKLIRS